MNVSVFYRDAFGKGGVPGEILSLCSAIAAEHEVVLIGRAAEHASSAFSVRTLSYRRLLELPGLLRAHFRRDRSDVMLIVGFFLPVNLMVVGMAKLHGVTLVLNPLAQVMASVFQGKIFTADPDVRRLETSAAPRLSLRQKLVLFVNPYLKHAYLQTVGRLIVWGCDRVGVFSSEEQSQFKEHLGTMAPAFVTLLWGIDTVPPRGEEAHYFRSQGFDDERANFVYWGRIDWHYKGIDRLLEAVRLLAERQGTSTIPFRIFLIGPDYRGGAARVRTFVEANGLAEVVHLQLPGSYTPGSKAPLMDADASIYLSRWDGFPRTLRESTICRIPVLVSKETHFGELVRSCESGIALEDADSPSEVAEALLVLADPERRSMCREGAMGLAPQLTWREIARRFIGELEKGAQR